MTDIIVLDRWQDAPPVAREIILDPANIAAQNQLIRNFAAMGTPVKELYLWQSKLTAQWYKAFVVLEERKP